MHSHINHICISALGFFLKARLKTLGEKKIGFVLFFILVALLEHKVRTAAAREYLNEFATLLLSVQCAEYLNEISLCLHSFVNTVPEEEKKRGFFALT